MSTKKLQILGSIGSNVELDATLTQEGKAADAKIVGDEITALKAMIGTEPVSDQIQSYVDEAILGGAW